MPGAEIRWVNSLHVYSKRQSCLMEKAIKLLLCNKLLINKLLNNKQANLMLLGSGHWVGLLDLQYFIISQWLAKLLVWSNKCCCVTSKKSKGNSDCFPTTIHITQVLNTTILTVCVYFIYMYPCDVKSGTFLALLDYVSRAHEIKIRPSSVVRRLSSVVRRLSSVVRPIISEVIAWISFKF